MSIGERDGNNEKIINLYPCHPGDVLREDVLPCRNIDPIELATRIGGDIENTLAVFQSQKPVTPELADALEKEIGYPPRLLMAMQRNYDKAMEAKDAMTVMMETEAYNRPPQLIRKHVDGPYVLHRGQIRWLTLKERVALFFGIQPVELRKHDGVVWRAF